MSLVAWNSSGIVLLGRAPAKCATSAVGSADSEPEGCEAVPPSGMAFGGARPTGIEPLCGAEPTGIEALCGAEPTGIETLSGAEPTGIETLSGAEPTGVLGILGERITVPLSEAKLTNGAAVTWAKPRIRQLSSSIAVTGRNQDTAPLPTRNWIRVSQLARKTPFYTTPFQQVN